MNPKKLFDALQKRSSMRVVRRVLAENGFPRGTGWKQIADKLNDKKVAAKADFPGLEDGLRQLLITTDKGLRIYKLDPKEANALRTAISALKIAQGGVFAQHFPYPVPDSIMKGLPPQPAEPVAKFQGKQSTGVLFSSVNIIEVRERLTPSQMGVKASDYDEIIGIKKVKFPTFDALIMSKSQDFAYVLTDAHLDTTQGTRRGLHSNIVETAKKLAKSNVLKSPVNLLPLIDPMYNSGAGAVKRLHYTTTTSSGKQEWMRGSGNDLRQELSHKAGMTALSGGFKGYSIRVEYPLAKVKTYTPRPLIEIAGVYRMTYEAKPRVEDATVWDCATIDELEHTLAELMLHISGSKSV